MGVIEPTLRISVALPSLLLDFQTQDSESKCREIGQCFALPHAVIKELQAHTNLAKHPGSQKGLNK